MKPIALTRLTVSLLAALLACAAASAKVSETFKQTYPLAAKGTVSVDNVNGAVEIVAWDRAEVALEAEKTAPDQDNLQRIHVVVNAGPDRFSVKTEYEKRSTGWLSWLWGGNVRGEVHYRLKVPADVALNKVSTVNADVTCTGVTGDVVLGTVNGRVEASGLAGTGKFDTVNGSITVDYVRMPAGRISLDTVNGSCRATLPKGSSFSLVADSINGGVHCDFPITLEKSGRNHVRGTVGTGGPEVKLDSVNGSLHVIAR